VGTAKQPVEGKAGHTLEDKLARLGIAREQDLVLHLPLRYEDRTQLCPLAAVQAGRAWQVEGSVINTDIQYRPRRQLVCLLGDGDAKLVLRFFNFYPSQQKALAIGRRVRAFGDAREGHFGLEMVHPSFHVVAPGTPLPDRLTPVYPTTAGLSQEKLRNRVQSALTRNPAYLAETLPPWTREPRKLWDFARAVRYLHEPPTDASQTALDERTHQRPNLRPSGKQCRGGSDAGDGSCADAGAARWNGSAVDERHVVGRRLGRIGHPQRVIRRG